MVEPVLETEAVMVVINPSPGINQMPPPMETNQKMPEKEAVEVGVKQLEALGEKVVAVEAAKEGGSLSSHTWY